MLYYVYSREWQFDPELRGKINLTGDQMLSGKKIAEALIYAGILVGDPSRYIINPGPFDRGVIDIHDTLPVTKFIGYLKLASDK